MSLGKISQSSRQMAIQAGLDAGMKQRYPISEKQQLFIKKVIAGYNGSEAARQAGYHQPGQAAYALLKNPRIQAALRLERQTIYDGSLAGLAVSALAQVMGDPPRFLAATSPYQQEKR